jgi:Flp pilus assembly protein TadD
MPTIEKTTTEKKGFGQRSGTNVLLQATILSAVSLTIFGTTSCATKSAAVHSTPYFSSTPTRQATNAIDAGDGDLEIASLRRTMLSHPDDVDPRLRLAQAYAARGFPDVALESYRLAAARFPDSASAAVRLARALRQAGQKDEALNGLTSFLHSHPQKIAEPYEWLGILNDDLQNWKASQLAYETALLYSPGSAELHNNLGYALLMQYLKSAAATEFRAALRIKGDLVIARNNLGIALASTPKEAISNWQAVSGPASAHNNMAALLIERGNYPEARIELATALGYDQQNAQAIYNLALVSERDGKPAVIPPPQASVRQGNPLLNFFHLARHSAKPVEGRNAGPMADRAVAPAGSAGGN